MYSIGLTNAMTEKSGAARRPIGHFSSDLHAVRTKKVIMHRR